jgi:hypothetical protein
MTPDKKKRKARRIAESINKQFNSNASQKAKNVKAAADNERAFDQSQSNAADKRSGAKGSYEESRRQASYNNSHAGSSMRGSTANNIEVANEIKVDYAPLRSVSAKKVRMAKRNQLKKAGSPQQRSSIKKYF